ncbi:hypothetical protein E4U19_006228 [Claviceps sp. Clav32 group G5]|nr:hypothetical protein E4U19_006228 [Claviceps sp. Clav32 group G5]KAG6043891.1 hypothetical protein E4U39_004021 [Claviceps sp. Clav50 group G5]
MSKEAGPSKTRRMLPTTELEDIASEGSDAGIMVGNAPSNDRSMSTGNDRIVVALPRIYEARASITGLQTRPLRNENAAGDLIETTSIAPRPVSFVCYECRIPRPFPGARSTRDGICYYCTLCSPAPLEGQVKWCSRGDATTRDPFLYRETYHDIPPNSGTPPNRSGIRSKRKKPGAGLSKLLLLNCAVLSRRRGRLDQVSGDVLVAKGSRLQAGWGGYRGRSQVPERRLKAEGVLRVRGTIRTQSHGKEKNPG